MSARRPTVVLKPGARRDFRAIVLHSGEHWGAAQRDAYSEEINHAFEVLSHNPQLAPSRLGLVRSAGRRCLHASPRDPGSPSDLVIAASPGVGRRRRAPPPWGRKSPFTRSAGEPA